VVFFFDFIGREIWILPVAYVCCSLRAGALFFACVRSSSLISLGEVFGSCRVEVESEHMRTWDSHVLFLTNEIHGWIHKIKLDDLQHE